MTKYRILVVDDEEINTITIKELLRKNFPECEVVTANDGDGASGLIYEAIALAKPFKILITDLQMPNMDGDELSELAKDEDPKIKIIMVSGTLPTKKLDCIDHVYIKGSNPDLLVDILKSIINPQLVTSE
ncbi:response regulator [Patescibacteria group bacterium]